MAWQARKVKISFAGSKILPLTDSTFVKYTAFKKTFGEDGGLTVLGIQNKNIFGREVYNNWVKLATDIKNIPGVQNVISTGSMFDFKKDTLAQKFVLQKIPSGIVQTDKEMDSLKNKIFALPFYDGLLYNSQTNATLLAISIDKKILNTAARNPILKEIERKAQQFEKTNHIKVHLSGMPFIRTATSKLVSNEFGLFLVLSILVSASILFVFFRNLSATFFSILVVVIGVVWSVGTLGMLGYEITILTGLVPPLIVIIGIPNSILILNKYLIELKRHKNKQHALNLAVIRITPTTLIANVTAAIGFGVLCFTGSQLLVQFGAVAALNILFTWLICLCLIPIIYSYLPAPKLKTEKEGESAFLQRTLAKIAHLVENKRKWIYASTIVICFVALLGVIRIQVNGYVVDDPPKNSSILTDLQFFEKNFDGIMPLEIGIDTKRKNGIMNLSTLNKIEKVENMIAAYPDFSRSISLNSGLKYATQAFYNGDPYFYRLPSDIEKNFVLIYLANSSQKGKKQQNNNLLNGFVDKNKQQTRISFQMKDVGSKRLNELLAEIKPKIDKILNPKKFEVTLTGSSIIFAKGTDYMLKHLVESIALAIVLISLLRFLQFKSIAIMLISLLPNIIPLLITAGIMGFCGIPLKPSTILIFTIAFGLASDQTIYFLTHYQQERKHALQSVKDALSNTINEAGISMTHIAIVLFFGFGVFAASTFGGTVILGLLLSITLLVALFFNLTLLPALVFWLNKKKMD
ncbi:MAG: MMPL family transporter [Sphingobacteriaceae bacterium]|nr:MMPL family transporter [Sphingobacteriaceae bacterium]